jgi:hypothetical protein
MTLFPRDYGAQLQGFDGDMSRRGVKAPLLPR